MYMPLSYELVNRLMEVTGSRKDYRHAENVDKGLMWFHALGFWQIKDVAWWYGLDIRRNGGIRAPDGGPCKERGQRQTCELIPKMDFNLRTKNIRARVSLSLIITIMSSIRLFDSRKK